MRSSRTPVKSTYYNVQDSLMIMGKMPFRFGIASTGAGSGAEWTAKALRAEELGYSTLVVPDHFIEQISPMPALAAAAQATSSLRVGSIVFCNDFRHPMLLAKEAATIDFLSEGRFELGLGAGWMKAEYDAIGLPFDSPGVRVSRLEEAVRVIKGYWGDEPFRFSGKHYTVDESKGVEKIPQPVQRPHPPLLIGGGGRRMLTLAAQEADIVGLALRVRSDGKGPDISDLGVSLETKVDWIRSEAGERFDEIELNVLTWALSITDEPQSVAETLSKRFGVSPDTLLELPFLLVGSLDEIQERLVEHRERFGISYFMIWDRDMEAFAPIAKRLTGK